MSNAEISNPSGADSQKNNSTLRDELLSIAAENNGSQEQTEKELKNSAASNFRLLLAQLINEKTDPNKGNLNYKQAEVQELISVDNAIRNANLNYFDDTNSVNDILQNGENRTQHEVAEESYKILLNFLENNSSNPDLSDEMRGSLQIMKEKYEAESQYFSEQFQKQNTIIKDIISRVGTDNELLTPSSITESVRNYSDQELDRLAEAVQIANDSNDPQLSFRVFTQIRRGTLPVGDSDNFNLWKENLVRTTVTAPNELQAATRTPKPKPVTENVIATPEPVVESKEKVVSPIPQTNKPEVNPVPQPESPVEQIASKEVESTSDRRIKNSLNRVPRDILARIISESVEQALAGKQDKDKQEMLARLNNKISGGDMLGLDDSTSLAFARMIDQNGFNRSQGGLWQELNARSQVGDLARSAYGIVKSIVGKIIMEDIGSQNTS